MRKENQWHPLKHYNPIPSYKPVIYANDPDMPYLPEEPDYNVMTIKHDVPTNLILRKKEKGKVL